MRQLAYGLIKYSVTFMWGVVCFNAGWRWMTGEYFNTVPTLSELNLPW